MPRILQLLCLCLALVAIDVRLGASDGELEDLTIRYVNSDVLTLWDVREKIEQRKAEYQVNGKVLPAGRDEWIAFAQTALEDLSDDQLLMQRAKEMGIRVNHDGIVLEVLERAKEAGSGLTLRDQALQRRILERQRFIDYLLGSLESLQPLPTPTLLADRYESGRAGYHRPARSRILQLVLRPADETQRTELRKAKADLLRKAQDAVDPAVKALVDQALNDFGVAAAADQPAVLDRLTTALAKLAERIDLGHDDAAVVDLARRLDSAGGRLLDRPSVEDRLSALRQDLVGKQGPGLITAFSKAKRALGIPPSRSDDGDWIEPGASRLDDLIQSLKPGETSTVTWIGDAAYLITVVEREDARNRSFDEVSGELDRQIRWERRKALKAQVIASLRRRASIHDVVPLNQLLRQVM